VTLCSSLARVGLLLLVAQTVVAPGIAAAHGATYEQIAALTLRIRDDPRNAELFVKRGDLYSEHDNWNSALDDYQRAAQLDPSLAIVDLARGRTLFNAGRFGAAMTAFDRFLAREPIHAEARILRARTLAQLGQWDASVADYTQAIDYLARLGAPSPDYYLERAYASASRGPERIPDTLRGLDDGIATLGTLAVLQLYAIELELKRERTDAALARLNSLVAQSNRRESLLARLGEILELAGRTDAARAAYEQAVSAINALSPRHRTTRATVELEGHLREALARLQRSAN
jgi:tetratricopeptide (TPR) repeat protein